MVNIAGLNKADVLAALYNNAAVIGLGVLHMRREDMTREHAQALLAGGEDNFDYLYGRVMKVNLKSDAEFDARLYDRDNGDGAAQSVIDMLRTFLGLAMEPATATSASAALASSSFPPDQKEST